MVSILPFPLLYGLSNFLYLLLFRVLGYRKKIVYQNLANSFPQKSTKELLLLQKEFYKYFCDLFLETFKTLTISKKSMLCHCRFDTSSLQLLKNFADQNESVLLVLGHKGNWEWAGNSFSLMGLHQLYVIYHPLENKYFDGLMYRMRSRFGTRLIAMKDTFKLMVQHKNELTATAFIADQTPQPQSAHWMDFLNQDTPVFLGAEKIALKMKRKLLFVSVRRDKRGYYTIYIEPQNVISPNELSSDEGQITEAHTRILENDIQREPETWLWTHRRWKHKRDK